MLVSPETLRPIVRDRVQKLLQASPAFGALPSAQQRQLAEAMTDSASYIAGDDIGSADSLADLLPSAAERLVAAVDFPEFVDRLVASVFSGIVSASEAQMKRFAALMANVAETLENYADDDVSDDPARDQLGARDPERTAITRTERRRLAQSRQQQLATMVLMGINRIVVTDGKIIPERPPPARLR